MIALERQNRCLHSSIVGLVNFLCDPWWFSFKFFDASEEIVSGVFWSKRFVSLENKKLIVGSFQSPKTWDGRQIGGISPVSRHVRRHWETLCNVKQWRRNSFESCNYRALDLGSIRLRGIGILVPLDQSRFQRNGRCRSYLLCGVTCVDSVAVRTTPKRTMIHKRNQAP